MFCKYLPSRAVIIILLNHEIIPNNSEAVEIGVSCNEIKTLHIKLPFLKSSRMEIETLKQYNVTQPFRLPNTKPRRRIHF